MVWWLWNSFSPVCFASSWPTAILPTAGGPTIKTSMGGCSLTRCDLCGYLSSVKLQDDQQMIARSAFDQEPPVCCSAGWTTGQSDSAGAVLRYADERDT